MINNSTDAVTMLVEVSEAVTETTFVTPVVVTNMLEVIDVDVTVWELVVDSVVREVNVWLTEVVSVAKNSVINNVSVIEVNSVVVLEKIVLKIDWTVDDRVRREVCRVVVVSTAGVLVRTSVDVDVKEILEVIGGNVVMVVDVIVSVNDKLEVSRVVEVDVVDTVVDEVDVWVVGSVDVTLLVVTDVETKFSVEVLVVDEANVDKEMELEISVTVTVPEVENLVTEVDTEVEIKVVGDVTMNFVTAVKIVGEQGTK